ncbi:MAG: tetratricopeptide repeat protein [Betaproteobacteria bacterium]|nr:tetratricopeptide repeat protein [Betaproteobacteria bacterium]
MPIIKPILRSRALIALALATVLGAFAPGIRADNTAVTKETSHEAQTAKKPAEQKRHTETLSQYQKALSNSIKKNGEQHKDTIHYRKEIGIAYLRMEKYSEARDILAQAAEAAGKGPANSDSADIYKNLGLALFRLDYPELSLDWYEKALAARESVSGADSAEVADICVDIASVHESLSDYASAAAFYGRALTIRENTMDETHPSVTALREKFTITRQLASNTLKSAATKKIAQETRLAKKYADQNRYDEALDHYKKARENFIAERGEQDSDIVRYENEIGIVYINMGKYAEARSFLTHAAEIASKDKELDSNNPDSATIYRNLGFALYRLGEYEEALNWYQKALAIRESALGSESLEMAETCEDIAAVYESQSNYQVALDWYNRALAVREKALGANHPSVVTVYGRVAAIRQRLGEKDETRDWWGKVVPIQGSENAEKTSEHHSAGFAYFGQGDYEKALKSYKQALAVEEKNLGAQNPVTMAIRHDIAGVYEKKGDYKQAVVWYKKTLADQEKIYGKGHHSTAATYTNIGVAEGKLGNNKNALESLREAIVVFEKAGAGEHSDAAVVYTNMAWVYSKMKNHDKAEEWARRAMAVNEKVFGKEHPTTGKSYSNVAATYMNQGQYDKAVSGYLEAYRIYLAEYGEAYAQTRSIRRNLELAYKQVNAQVKDPKPFDAWLAESLANR